MKRGCDAKNDRSNASSLEKSGGFGNTPWVNAKVRTGIAHHGVEDELDEHRLATAG